MRLGLRKGPWKFIPDGTVNKAAGREANRKPTMTAVGSLFNLTDDLGETANVAAEHPDLVKKLADMLQTIRQGDRTRP